MESKTIKGCLLLIGIILASTSIRTADAFLQQQSVCPSSSGSVRSSSTSSSLSGVLFENRKQKHHQGFVNVNPKTAIRDIPSFEEWAMNYGIQKNMQLVCEKFDEHDDWNAKALQDLPTNSPVLFVPSSMILSSHLIKSEFGTQLDPAEHQLMMNGVDRLIPNFRLMIKILREYELGEQSSFWPWLNSLPRVSFIFF